MLQKVSRTMSNYYIRSLQHALDIIAAYEHCGSCDRCPLSTPEGWRCSYLYDCALRYIERHKQDAAKTSETHSA